MSNVSGSIKHLSKGRGVVGNMQRAGTDHTSMRTFPLSKHTFGPHIGKAVWNATEANDALVPNAAVENISCKTRSIVFGGGTHRHYLSNLTSRPLARLLNLEELGKKAAPGEKKIVYVV